MTDLSKGILDFGEIVVTPDTAKEELLSVYGEKLSLISTDKYLKFKRSFWVDGTEFSCLFVFDADNKLDYVKLSPYIDYKSEDWDRFGQQEERRRFCDKWLYERLGAPHKTLSGDIEYTFISHKIGCFSNNDIRDGGSAGYIVVTYK